LSVPQSAGPIAGDHPSTLSSHYQQYVTVTNWLGAQGY
jgi:hypothetical protein